MTHLDDEPGLPDNWPIGILIDFAVAFTVRTAAAGALSDKQAAKPETRP